MESRFEWYAGGNICWYSHHGNLRVPSLPMLTPPGNKALFPVGVALGGWASWILMKSGPQEDVGHPDLCEERAKGYHGSSLGDKDI